MNIFVAITTHNRPVRVRRAVDDVKRQLSIVPEIHVYDDGSDVPFEDPECHVTRFAYPHGKREYWKVVDRAWRDVRHRRGQYDAFLFMQDDIRIPGAHTLFTAAWSLDATGGVSLNLYGDGPSPHSPARWTRSPLTYDERLDLYESNWLDLACVMFAPAVFDIVPSIDPIPPDRWDDDPTLSSGVGRQLSRRLLFSGQWMVTAPWVEHRDGGISIMNPHRNE